MAEARQTNDRDSSKIGLTDIAGNLDFTDQSVLITGAASGIGNATAKILHQFGANIIALDIQEKALQELADTLNKERITTIPFDLSETDPEAYKELGANIINASPSGKIDAFIMSAGVIQLTKGKGIRNTPAWEFQKLNQINALSNGDIFREISDHFAKDARIVMVTSPIVSRPDFKTPGYAISKGLMEAVTKQMMGDLTGTDIKITGFVAPPVQNFLRADLKPNEPLHAHPHGEDIAELPARLASRSLQQRFHGQVVAMGYSLLRQTGQTPDGNTFDFMPRGKDGFLYLMRIREIATSGGDLGEVMSLWETSSSRILQGLGPTPDINFSRTLKDVYKAPGHVAKYRLPSTTLGNIGRTKDARFITQELSTGETPMYSPYDQCYYYVDIENGDIHQYDPQSGSDKKWHLDKGMVGGVVVNSDGTLIGNAQDGLFAFDPETGALAMIRPIEPDKPNNRPNDMNVFELADGSTRIAIGCIPVDRKVVGPDERPGTVYVVHPQNLELKAIWDNHVTSNALCGYTENGENVIFYAETDKNHKPRIWRANYNAETDSIENEKLFLEREDFQGGRPDGAHIIDVNGQRLIAVAALDTNRVIGYDVETAEAVMSVDAPENLTLTHAVFGPDAHGGTMCLINSSRRKSDDGNVKPGVAVIVPIKSAFNVQSLMPVAKGYPSFAELTKGKAVEILASEIICQQSNTIQAEPELPENH